MNKYNKEYEEMSLCDFADELVEPLNTVKQDLTKAIYIHYAKERDKNEQLQQENKELHNKIDKAIEYLETNGYGYDCCGDMCYFLDENNQKDLLEILKESEVDEYE